MKFYVTNLFIWKHFHDSADSFLLPIPGHVADFEDSAHPESSAETFYQLQTQKRERIKYDSRQLRELEAAFAISQYPSATERDQLAKKIGVTESRIQVHGYETDRNY